MIEFKGVKLRRSDDSFDAITGFCISRSNLRRIHIFIAYAGR